jgi:acyl-CoA thioesterase I
VTQDPDPTPPGPPSPPTLRFSRLLAFGDSLTEGKTSLAALMSIEFPQSYTLKLQGKLAARYTAQTITVADLGLGGERAEEGVSRLPGVLQNPQPDLVLLMEGANDLSALGATGPSRAAAAMDQMVRICKTRNLAVMLAGIPPERPGGRNAGGVSLVAPYNDRLREVALSNGVEFVDIAAGFQDDPSLLSLLGSDGLHPTDAGYERIAQAFYDRIVAVYEQPPPLAGVPAVR